MVYTELKTLSKNYPNNYRVWQYASFCKKYYGGEFISKEAAIKKKKSDRIYILGTGSSINDLTRNEIAIINNNDSVGINEFCYHPTIIPTYYSLELWTLETADQCDFKTDVNRRIADEINIKWEKYANTTFIVKPRVVLQKEIVNLLSKIKGSGNLYWNKYNMLPGSNKFTFSCFLKIYHELGLLRSNNYFPNKAASVIWCLGFAFKLGYKEIVLTGVDLQGHYFYDLPTSDQLEMPTVVKLHNTADPKKVHDGITVMDLIDTWNDIVLKPSGIRLFVSHQNSLLSNCLPVGGFN